MKSNKSQSVLDACCGSRMFWFDRQDGRAVFMDRRRETHVLKDVLRLPYGFEIYSLLTRWNPLNLSRPMPKPDSGRKVLVAGMPGAWASRAFAPRATTARQLLVPLAT